MRVVKKKTPVEVPAVAKKSELSKVIGDIEKTMGKGTIVKGDTLRGFNHISTESFMLDYALLGGFTEGNGTMIYGNENCGKTTMLYKAIANHQRKYTGRGDGETCAFVDLEDKYDADWAEKMGVNVSLLEVVKPGMGENAVDAIEAMMRAKECGMVVMDSIAAILPKVILEKSAEDATVGRRAQLVGLLCSKLQQVWIDEGKRGHHPTFICTNQWREKIGVMWGSPNTLPGGKYQHFMVNTKFEIQMKAFHGGRKADGSATTKAGEIEDGLIRTLRNTHTFKFPKQKHGFSVLQGEFDMVMDDPHNPDGLATGWIDDAKVVATYAKRDGVISGGGGAFRLPDTDRKFATLDEICSFLYAEPEHFIRIKQALIGMKRIANGLPLVPKDGYLLDW